MGIKCFLFVFHPHHLMIHLSGHGGSGLRVRMRVCVCVCARARVRVCVCVVACVRVRMGRQVAVYGPAACERTTPASQPAWSRRP